MSPNPSVRPAAQLEGDISDQERSFLDSGTSLPAVCGALRKAALDPRVQVRCGRPPPGRTPCRSDLCDGLAPCASPSCSPVAKDCSRLAAGPARRARGFVCASPPLVPHMIHTLVPHMIHTLVPQGVAIEIGPLGIGWAKAQELRRHIEHFNKSGKYSVAWMKTVRPRAGRGWGGGVPHVRRCTSELAAVLWHAGRHAWCARVVLQGAEKEYYLASACKEVYAPTSAYFSLRGFVTGGEACGAARHSSRR